MTKWKDPRIHTMLGVFAACALTGVASLILGRRAFGMGMGLAWLHVCGPAVAYVSWYAAARICDRPVGFTIVAALCAWCSIAALNVTAALVTGGGLARLLFVIRLLALCAVPGLSVMAVTFAVLRATERRTEKGYRLFPVVGAGLGALLGLAQYWVHAGFGAPVDSGPAWMWICWQAIVWSLFACGAALACRQRNRDGRREGRPNNREHTAPENRDT